MMLNYYFWEGVNYMFWLLMAYSTFMVPLKKRTYFFARYFTTTILGLLVAGLIWTMFPESSSKIQSFWFWTTFFIVSIPYLWFCCSLTISETLYCTICGFAMQHFASESCLLFRLVAGEIRFLLVVYIAIYLLTYLLFYHMFVKRLVENGKVDFQAKKSGVALVSIILIVLILSVLKKDFYTRENVVLSMVCQIYDMFCCAFALWVQVSQKEALHYQHELDLVDYMWHQQQEQFHLTQENIDIINRKCHDLKHQVRVLGNMQNGAQKKAFIINIEDAIMIYDASIDTGNKVLDTVIMEKSLFCKEHGITLSCIADGSKLGFMDTIDLYTVFGNALDNAIESVNKLMDYERKVIVVKIFTKDDLLMIQVENYYDEELVFVNDIPVTTKGEKNFHGYGIKSIKYTIQKYNGCITINTDKQMFRLQILIPLPINV